MFAWSGQRRELPRWANLVIIVAAFAVVAIVGVWQS